MGGHALKKVETVRKAAAVYEKIKAHVLELARSAGFECRTPLEMPGKESYGDLDVLYIKEPTRDVRAFVSETFKPDEIVCSGDVLSFNITQPADQPDLHHFQIDFIGCNKDEFDSSFFYFSFGDMGGILGRMANAHGLKLGAAGLWMNVNLDRFEEMCSDPSLFDATLVSQRIHLTNSPEKICEFFGLDHARWGASFDTSHAMFEWVCSSSLFSPAVFSSLNYEHRQRAEKRPFYIEFLKYIEVERTAIGHACDRRGEVISSKQREALDFFDKHDVLAALRAEQQQTRDRNAKFSAALFQEHGLTGAALGAAIRAFRAHIIGTTSGASEQVVGEKEEANPVAALASLTLRDPALPRSPAASPNASPRTARRPKDPTNSAWDQWLDAHTALEVRAEVEAFSKLQKF
eukprot:m.75830 g.75830  ORF g.75830 m.75830 type:complete len:405 (+) comp13146_c1_seq1:168-1382(+)